MSIKLNEPKVVATSQEYQFESVTVFMDTDGIMKAYVTFKFLDENKSIISSEVIRYEREDFDAFWTGFNSGKFLYEELISKKALPIVAEDSLNDEFINALKP